MVNREFVLSFFRTKTRKPLSFRETVSSMGLSHAEARALKRLLRQMMREGKIVMTRKGFYGLAEDLNLMTGYFEAHKDGYGFVMLENPGEQDVFVPARATSGAMNNDRVIVRVENWLRREGRIVRVLERATTRIVGRLDIGKNAVYVRPKKKTIPFDLLISPGERGDAKHGDTVVAEVTSYESEKRSPSGRVLKVLEKPEGPVAEMESIIEEFNLPCRFPRIVLDETKSCARTIDDEDTHEKRKDLRTLSTVTIDGERARDFDDAVSVRLIDHGYRLWVHIADVSYYVGWHSAVDNEAKKRGTSVYFPDRVIPMLPKELSEDLCSLKPKVGRFAFTVEMDFGREGERVNAKFYPSLIRSDERMTYTSVRRILVDLDHAERERYEYLLPDFELMNELCGILRRRRIERGSLDFDLPEPEVLLDLQGNLEAIIRADRNLAHMIIEEFMIAANEAVAEHLEALGIPILYRIHEEPDPMKLEDIMKVMKMTSRMRKKALRPGDLSQLLVAIKGAPGEEIINYMVLRSLKQARYSPVNVGHFGLASRCYTHFTSPIRRYPDLVVHRILRESLRKKRLRDKRVEELTGILPDIAFHSSKMERLADEVEREVVNAMRVWFMKDRVGEEFDGKVIGITPYGIRVRLKDFYVEGFIHVSYMTDDFYSYDQKSLSLSGRNTGRTFKIGKNVVVRVDRVDQEGREILFGLINS